MLQDERFAIRTLVISPRELQLSKALSENLKLLVSKLTPAQVKNNFDVENAVKFVQKTEKAFKGALPPDHPYAFGCNSVGTSTIPPGAGVRPVSY